MLSTNFSIIDYFVFGFLLIASSLIGVYFWWKSRNNASNSEFLTGNRKLGVFPVTLSLVASFMSTNTILGAPAEVYQVGTQFVLQNVSIVLSIILAAEVFMPIYYKLEVISVHEGSIEAGGLGELWRINKEGGRLIFFNFKFDLYNHNNIWNVLFGTIIYWCAVYCVMQTQVQRYCSMESPQKARR
ncbi:unnamed protein product, partial [Medioppia subpectinata]